MKNCDCELCSAPPADRLRDLHEDLERVLALTERIGVLTTADSDWMRDARQLVRKASETAASMAERVARLQSQVTELADKLNASERELADYRLRDFAGGAR